LLTAGELQLASDTNAGGNALSPATPMPATPMSANYYSPATPMPAVVIIVGEFAMRQE
jgi:hypothetical protein